MVQHFDVSDVPITPWKNGGGHTRELVCWPPGAGLDAFDWRVSIATIAQSGPFSVYAGIDRSITLLSGAGVRLQGPGVDHLLNTPLVPHSFSGDVPLHGQLLADTASTDFNVMTRKGRAWAQVQSVSVETTLAESLYGLVFAVFGNWRITPAPVPAPGPAQAPASTTDPRTLQAGQGLWWADAKRSWRLQPLSPDARLLAVSLRQADAQGEP